MQEHEVHEEKSEKTPRGEPIAEKIVLPFFVLFVFFVVKIITSLPSAPV